MIIIVKIIILNYIIIIELVIKVVNIVLELINLCFDIFIFDFGEEMDFVWVKFFVLLIYFYFFFLFNVFLLGCLFNLEILERIFLFYRKFVLEFVL